jgi:methylated-DNA-[protein]-cysteine S-methyltransferase
MIQNKHIIQTSHACFELTLNDTATALTRLQWVPTKSTPCTTTSIPLMTLCLNNLNQYFIDTRHIFTIPIERVGTPFQMKVWDYLLSIPHAKTRSYGALAKALNTSARAIGQACANNPLPLIYPCHRVVAAKGIGGFFHQTNDNFFITIKKQLLMLEADHKHISYQ